MGKFLSWNIGIRLIKKMEDEYSMELDAKELGPSLEYGQYNLNETGAEIVRLLDGSRKYKEIVQILAEKYHEKPYKVSYFVKQFFYEAAQGYHLQVVKTSEPVQGKIEYIERTELYPEVASIELTTRCNLRCMHCYGTYGEIEDHTLTLEEIKHIMDDLKSVGVNILELTGGDISVHPDLKEIILYALEKGFGKIGFLTNGVLITQEILDIIVANKERFIVQIDLQSLDDDYLTWFTKVPNTLERIKHNIAYLGKNGVMQRVATIVTKKNIYEMEAIADWAASVGVSTLGFTTAIQLGRACDADPDLAINTPEMVEMLTKIVDKIEKKHPMFQFRLDKAQVGYRNCNCIAKHVYITPTGQLKFCAMDTTKYFRSGYGNILEKPLKEIYDEKAHFIRAIYEQESPKADSSHCYACKKSEFCDGCMLRGIISAKERKEECGWYKYELSEVIKKEFDI